MIRRGFALLPAAFALLSIPRTLAAEAAVGEAIVPITPCRAVDTRNPSGALGGPALGANQTRIFTLTGTCSVPSNALGLAVNLTVVLPAAAGYAQIYAGDAAAPPTQVLSFNARQTRASNALVALASDASGTVALANVSGGPADFIIDISGYFVPACTATITVTNPATTTGAVSAAFSQTFTASGGTGTKTFTSASTLPAGLTLAANGTLSGTPTQPGTFPITVTATDANGCTGTGSTYTLVIACQSITVTNPGVTTGTANAPFSQTFTQSGGVGTTTFSTSSPLPTGMTLASNGVLSGTPTQAGGFPIVVVATDANGCTGAGATYTLVVNCQAITVTNPGVTTGTAGAPFSQTFTQSGAIGAATFTTTSTLPTGLALSTGGVLSGTPTVTGTFPIVVKVKDGNLCTGTGATYNLVIGCGTIVVSNPATSTATAGTAFSQTFTQAGAIGTATFTTSSTLPTGLTLSTGGVLSGTPTVTGTFSIVVKVTDANGCIGTGATYSLVVSCQSYSVGPPTLPQGTTGVLYPSVTFTSTGGIGTVTFTQTGALPTGMGFSIDTLSGTPSQSGSFPITIKATDSNGCTSSRDYLLVVVCPGTPITLSPSSLPTVSAGNAFPSTQFTASGGAGGYVFAEAGALPTGMTFLVDTLSGTPTQTGTFPITISVTDSGTCTGSQDYVVTVTCNGVSITVAPPSLAPASAGTPYGTVTFSVSSGGTPPYTFTETGALPSGMTFSSSLHQLSGTPTQGGTFPITVTATDANGCTGAIAYSFVVVCPTITVTNPAVNTGTAGAAFSQTFTQTGIPGTPTWSETGALPSGITLNPSTGVLSGTTSQTGTFPITVKVTDANGCFGTSSYTLTITCQTITVTNPGTSSGTAGVAFSQTFTDSGILGTATWSESGTLPTGITLNSSTGVLSGTPTQTGSFPITVTATDTNGCAGTSATYTLVIACPTITVTRSGGGSFPAGTFNAAYAGQGAAASGSTGTPYTFIISSGALPTGLSISSAGAISGTPSATGTYTFTVKATDTFGCFGSQSFSIAIKPVAAADSYSGLVDNTQFVVTGGLTASPATPFVGTSGSVTFRLTNNDLPSGGVTPTAGSFATTAGGVVTIAVDGTFLYTPAPLPTFAATTTDSFTYTISSDTGATGTPTSATGTVTLNLSGRVWYVKNNGGAGNGQSQSPFNALSSAIAASTANDNIFVYRGDGTTTNLATASVLKTGQKFIGEGVALVVNSSTLVPAGSFPLIGNTLTLANNVTVNGIDMSTGSSNAITGSGVSGITVTARNVTTTTGIGVNITGSGNGGTMTFTQVNAGTLASGPASGIVLDNFAGAFTVAGTGTAGSGGTIQKTGGSGISLTSVSGSASFTDVNISSTAGDGITGATVANFSCSLCNITNPGSSAGKDGLRLTDLSGSASLTNVTVTGATQDGCFIQNSSATLTSLTVTGGSFGSSNNAFFTAGSGMEVLAVTTGVITSATISGTTFANNFSTGLQSFAQDTATIGDITVSGCTFTNNGAAAADFDAGTGSPSMKFHFLNNLNITGNVGPVVNVFSSSTGTGGLIQGRIDGNHIGAAGTAGSGSTGGPGIRVFLQGVAGNITIVNNVIRETACSRGIDVETLGPAPANGSNRSSDIVIIGNDVDNKSSLCASPEDDIYLASDNQAGTSTTLRAEVHGNKIKAAGASPANTDYPFDGNTWLYFNIANTPSTAQLVNFGGHANANAEIAATQTSGTAAALGTVTLIPGPITTVP